MNNKETPEERRTRYKELPSNGRKSLIRKKLKAQGLEEGSGIVGKDLSVYNNKELIDLIILTRELYKKKKSN